MPRLPPPHTTPPHTHTPRRTVLFSVTHLRKLPVILQYLIEHVFFKQVGEDLTMTSKLEKHTR
jgi:hypothetical protein